ncbi:IclR family transcriptional regulator [Streptomyces sp. NPDC055400]
MERWVLRLRRMALVEEDTRWRYRLTMRVAALGRAARQGTSLGEVADPFLRALADEVSETVLLIRLVQGLPVCVHGAESNRPYRLSFEVGQNLPPLRGASARVLLGGLSQAERERYVDRALASGAVPPLNGREEFLQGVDIADEREEFLQGVDIADERGWDVSHHEIDEGIWAVSAAIRDDDRTVAALSLSCPEFRLDDARRKTYTDRAVAPRSGSPRRCAGARRRSPRRATTPDHPRSRSSAAGRLVGPAAGRGRPTGIDEFCSHHKGRRRERALAPHRARSPNVHQPSCIRAFND